MNLNAFIAAIIMRGGRELFSLALALALALLLAVYPVNQLHLSVYFHLKHFSFFFVF